MRAQQLLGASILLFLATSCFVDTGQTERVLSDDPVRVAVHVAASREAAEDEIHGPLPEGCTCIMVGRLASTDGSVITSHTCDGRYRTWLDVVAGKKHKEDSKAEIFKGRMKTEFPSDLRGVTALGTIPQVDQTYTIFDTAYPCMNEHQLAMGESTFGGRPELESKKGLFYIEELQRIALERTRTARDAIRLMGALASKHGYIDSGEALAVADPKEVWHFEILGSGKDAQGAVWAAVRIPDDHVGVAANICRISTLDLEDGENYMASDNVISLAEEKGWYDPAKKEPFKFWKAYSGRRPFRVREWWVFDQLAPSLALNYLKTTELPLSVKPDSKVSVEDVFELFRATYEGTDYALNRNLVIPKGRISPSGLRPVAEQGAEQKSADGGAKSIETLDKQRRADLSEESLGRGNQAARMEVCDWAHPWLSRDEQTLFNTLRPGTISFHRPIAVMFNAYHTVIQCRGWLPDPVGGICWLGFDNPATTPRAPIFAGVTDLPADFKVDNHKKYRTDSASWAFRRASRLACIRWGKNKKRIQERAIELEKQALTDLPFVEQRAAELFEEDPAKAREFLTRYTISFCRAMTHQFWELGDELWMDYLYYL